MFVLRLLSASLPDTAIKQQCLAAWKPVGTPRKFIGTFAFFGTLLVVVGIVYSQGATDSVIYREQYDGPGTPLERAGCKIRTANAGNICTVRVEVKEKMEQPVHVFYEIDGFHQNHRRYVQSLEWLQLHNREHLNEKALRQSDCSLLNENKTKLLNPCGLLPNTLFNDVISLDEDTGFEMKENKIAWRSDIRDVLKQPEGFEWRRARLDYINDTCFEDRAYLSDVKCERSTCEAYGISNSVLDDGCLGYVCQGSYYDDGKCAAGDRVVFHYDRVDEYAYLYQTFPQVVSPLVGVNAQHFAVWMRPAGLPHFRKLYGRITEDVPKDTDLTFTVENNWDVRSFDGKKYLVVASGEGFEASFLGAAYIAVGAACLCFGAFFLGVHFYNPRVMGDPKYIPWIT